MKFKLLSLVFALVFIIAACNDGEDDEVRSLEVDLTVPEETVSAGETAEFSAHVTSNDEDVTDADQVRFEVLSGEDSVDMIEAEHGENGIYTIEYSFDEPGTYTVISHVDAFQLHTMPEAEVSVE